MRPEDLAKLHAKAFSASRAWSATEFADLLKRKDTVLTGDADSFVLMRVVADEAEILTLATNPSKRRQGRARAALRAAEDAARGADVAALFLEVAEDNVEAKALYAAENYTQVGRRPGYYLPKNAAPIAALVLRKELKAD